MSDLTRDEIKRACEAVPGWEWDDVDGCAFDPTNTVRFADLAVKDRAALDAIALLEATGEQWITGRTDDGRLFAGFVMPYPNSDDLEVCAPDLPTAAVRAVNAWKEGKQ